MINFKKIQHEHLSEGVALPVQWTENIARSYEEFFSKYEVHFQTYGHIFGDEILLIISSYTAAKPENHLSVFISFELGENIQEHQTQAKKILEHMSDLAGIIFQELLEQKAQMKADDLESDLYQLDWKKTKFLQKEFYYKISRENIELTLAAEEILKRDSLSH